MDIDFRLLLMMYCKRNLKPVHENFGDYQRTHYRVTRSERVLYAFQFKFKLPGSYPADHRPHMPESTDVGCGASSSFY